MTPEALLEFCDVVGQSLFHGVLATSHAYISFGDHGGDWPSFETGEERGRTDRNVYEHESRTGRRPRWQMPPPHLRRQTIRSDFDPLHLFVFVGEEKGLRECSAVPLDGRPLGLPRPSRVIGIPDLPDEDVVGEDRHLVAWVPRTLAEQLGRSAFGG